MAEEGIRRWVEPTSGMETNVRSRLITGTRPDSSFRISVGECLVKEAQKLELQEQRLLLLGWSYEEVSKALAAAHKAMETKGEVTTLLYEMGLIVARAEQGERPFKRPFKKGNAK